MKYPRLFKIVASFNLVLAQLFAFISVAGLSSMKEGYLTMSYFDAVLVVLIPVLTIWLFVSGILWMIEHEGSFTLLALNGLMFFGVFGVLTYQLTQEKGAHDALYFIFFGIMIFLSVSGFFQMVGCFLPGVLGYAKKGGRVTSFAHPIIIALFLFLAIIPNLSVAVAGKIGYMQNLPISRITTSGGDGYSLVDTNAETYWQPAFGTGVDETVKIEFAYSVPVDEISFVTGFPAMFKEYNRMRSVLVQFSNGEKILHDFNDSSDIQKLKAGGKESTYLIFTVKAVYPGEKRMLRVESIIPKKRVPLFPPKKG